MRKSPLAFWLSDREPEGSLCRLESRWYRVGEDRVHAVAACGPFPAGAVPIVLVHGLGVSGKYMKPLAGQLGACHPTYAPDLPGFGRSSKPGSAYSLARLADVLAGWLEAARIESPVLVGNSFGCQIIVELAVRHPGRASALVLQGPTMDAAARTAYGQAWRFLNDARREPMALMPVVLSDYMAAGPKRILATFLPALRDAIERKAGRVGVPAR